jgi:hypothetical protein
MNIDLASEGNPYHEHKQEPRVFTPQACADCGTESSIDGGVPVDLFHIKDGTEAGISLALCLGCLANRRALGVEMRRV